jgi:hypothetical protein
VKERPLTHLLETYLRDIALTHASGAGVKELSYYPALAGLLSEVGKTLKPKICCVSQLRNLGSGLPDFGLFTTDQLQRSAADPLPGQKPARGVVEVKDPAVDLNALVKTPQVQGYVQEYGLALLTNLREFALVGSGPHGTAILERCVIAESETVFWQAAAHAHKTANQHGESVVEFIKRAMTHAAPILEPKDPAWLLASYARDARLRVEQAGDLALTAGWGHGGREGVTMPGKGRIIEHSDPTWGTIYDVYLNDVACWQAIPAVVWDFTIDGYQLIKKWLSYREHSLLGRDLRVEEARYVTEMARRLAALVRMQPELDANYHVVSAVVYLWPGEA